jgi:hypothetical protein
LARKEHPLNAKEQFAAVVAIACQNVTEKLVQVSRDVLEFLSQLVDIAIVVFFVQNLSHQDNPEKDTRGFLLDVSSNPLGEFAVANLQFAVEISGDILAVFVLFFKGEVEAPLDRNVGVMSAGEANFEVDGWICLGRHFADFLEK